MESLFNPHVHLLQLKPEAQKLVSRQLSVFVKELLKRAEEVRVHDSGEFINVRHLEQVLPQLMLDFW